MQLQVILLLQINTSFCFISEITSDTVLCHEVTGVVHWGHNIFFS